MWTIDHRRSLRGRTVSTYLMDCMGIHRLNVKLSVVVMSCPRMGPKHDTPYGSSTSAFKSSFPLIKGSGMQFKPLTFDCGFLTRESLEHVIVSNAE